ncbi:patatin-like protein [Saccharopolyspora griseoalba]|uniref:Patatin-like protein n=1 Tax=Saccharopolyspora griseoalba TaxID=1431848 RepID=A0ABW2LPE2_9PSEU
MDIRENPRELRLALAMRGGASMAVWIGGAVAEINRLRESLSPGADSEHPWARLAKLVGYDAVSVDVLAGASAGGLNAALLAADLVHGTPFERMRRTWVRLADVEAMARPVPRFWQPGPESLLDGDGYFRSALARALAEGARPPEQRPGARTDLLLTATLLDPIAERHFDARLRPMRELRRAAMFRFHHEGAAGDPLSDFGTDPEPTALRLAHAARSTSSFPFAFEPARVHSSPGEPPPGEPNMLGLFSETTERGGPFRVIDGGVLDNIPVTAAIEAIAASPADRPTQRYLLYLNPDPNVSQSQRREPALPLPVTLAALRDRFDQESLLSDLDALDEHNRAVRANDSRREALLAPLLSAPAAERPAELARLSAAVESQHAVVRAELDAEAAHALLTEPAGSEDGTLLPPVVGDPLAGWSGEACASLRQRLTDGLAEIATTGIFDDVRGLRAAIGECLGWAREIELFAADHAAIGRCKARLYRLQQFAAVLQGHADRYWVGGARLEPIVDAGELETWVRRVTARRDRLQHRLPSPVEPLLGAVLAAVDDGAGFSRALADFAAELGSIVESSGADAAPEESGVDAVARARAVLHDLADRLAAVAPPRAEVRPEHVAHAMLEDADRRPEVLRQLVVLTAPLDLERAPGSRVELLRVVSDEQSPLPFTELREGDRLRIQDKIRGLDLGNFGAFLSAKWRANDWMWGRMDAAAALVGLLTDPARLVARHGGADELADALAAIVNRPTEAELGALTEERTKQWRGFLAEVWARHAGEVHAELAALFAGSAEGEPLPRTRALLTERLQWTIAAAEIPYVESVSTGADVAGGGETEVPAPAELSRAVESFDVGRQRVSDLGEPRRLSIATRLGLLAYRAIRPRGRGVAAWIGRRAMTALKPLYLLLAFAVAAPTRAAVLGFTGAAAGTLAGPPVDGLAPLPLLGGAGPPHPVQLVGLALVLLLAAWAGHRLTSRLGEGAVRLGAALLVGAVLAGSTTALVAAGLHLGPLTIAVLAAVLTHAAAPAYRPGARLGASALTLALFAVLHLLAPHLPLLLVVLATAYAQTTYATTFDVLPPRPRPRTP